MSTNYPRRNLQWLPARITIRGSVLTATIAIITFAGCSAGGPSLVPSAAKVEFGNVAVGASTSQLLTLTNMGNVNISIGRVSVSGEGFSVSGGSKVMLAPNQAVTVSIGFNPATAGKAHGLLSVMTTDALSGSVVRVALLGSGEATSSKHSVALSWQATSQAIGYFIYRSTKENGALSKLNASLDESTSFIDGAVTSGETYQYVVTSVNSSNVESAASNQITVTIPSP